MTHQSRGSGRNAPQQSLLFRLIAAATKLRLRHRYRRSEHPTILISVYVVLTGTISLGTIAVVALFFEQSLIFPSLAPTAFILFYTPMAPTACPRTVVLSHTSAVLCGIGGVYLVSMLWPGIELVGTTDLNWARVVAIMLVMGTVSGFMSIGRFAHPPAAASGLLPVLGFMENMTDAGSLAAGAVLLAAEAYVLNRGLAGLPYPVWRYNPETVENYRALAGISSIERGYTETLAEGISRTDQ